MSRNRPLRELVQQRGGRIRWIQDSSYSCRLFGGIVAFDVMSKTHRWVICNRNLQLSSGVSKTSEILRKMRCFYGVKPNPSQDLPAYHAANSERLWSRDEHAATDSVDCISFRCGDLADLAVVEPDFLSVGDRVRNRFDEVVQVRLFAMPDW